MSVRDLASRFETSRISESSARTSSNNTDTQINGVNRSQEYVCEKWTQDSGVNSHNKVGPTISAPDNASTSGALHQRHRSKSESDFLASSKPSKPKSVLAKKNKSNANKPRKSVTFSANVCLVAASDGWHPESGDHVTEAGYQSDEEGCTERLRNREEEDSSTSADSPIEMLGEGACTLCHKKGVQEGQNYCDKCSFYLSRFQPR